MKKFQRQTDGRTDGRTDGQTYQALRPLPSGRGLKTVNTILETEIIENQKPKNYIQTEEKKKKKITMKNKKNSINTDAMNPLYPKTKEPIMEGTISNLISNKHKLSPSPQNVPKKSQKTKKHCLTKITSKKVPLK